LSRFAVRYYNPRVTQVSEAKDFLVKQTAIQAALDGVTLSDVEKRMMCFTEGPDATEHPTELNDEFEAEHDTATYEAKVSKLLRRAYARVKKENPETARTFNDSLLILKKGDHYMLVLWGVNDTNILADKSTQERPPYDNLKLISTAFLVVALLLGIIFTADHYHLHWNRAPQPRGSTPVWLGRLLIFMLAAGYVYSVVLPWIFKKSPLTPTQLFLKLFRRSPDETSDPHTERSNRND
jgi:hypothetical protein